MDTGEEILDANSVTNYKSDSIYSMIAFFFFYHRNVVMFCYIRNDIYVFDRKYNFHNLERNI